MMTYIGYTKLCKVNYCVCVIKIYILIIAKRINTCISNNYYQNDVINWTFSSSICQYDIAYWMINITKPPCGWYFLLSFISGLWFLAIISWLQSHWPKTRSLNSNMSILTLYKHKMCQNFIRENIIHK